MTKVIGRQVNESNFRCINTKPIIIFYKGASVLRMLDSFMGTEKFQEGLQVSSYGIFRNRADGPIRRRTPWAFIRIFFHSFSVCGLQHGLLSFSSENQINAEGAITENPVTLVHHYHTTKIVHQSVVWMGFKPQC